eukprot:scaffold215479_cov14-Tisochrysis_lutea.AAC.1
MDFCAFDDMEILSGVQAWRGARKEIHSSHARPVNTQMGNLPCPPCLPCCPLCRLNRFCQCALGPK